MRDKLLFDILQDQINTLQEARVHYRKSEYLSDGVKDATDKDLCHRIEVLEDFRTVLVSKGFFSEE